MSGDFARLHPSVRYLVRDVLRFPGLRPVQEATIAPILDQRDCIVLAPTAGGKTEAAAFPVLSRVLSDRLAAVSTLYICPLRALLNNQEARLSRMAEAVGLRVGKWHGDVPAATRRAIVAEPPDVLMITPESLEVLLISPADNARLLLPRVRIAVIDEVHAFAADPRGAHLLSVLERLQLRSGTHIQRIGLSATVGNPAALARWLQGSGATAQPVVVAPASERKKAEFAWHAAQGTRAAAGIIRDLGAGQKRLVFVESRSRAEELAKTLQEVGVQVWVHHSSVGRAARDEAELAFETAPGATLVATSSLELGIDIGDLDHIFQLDAPATVSSLAQRLGRTGRRAGTVPRMTFVADAPEDLLLALALVSRFEEGWVEAIAPSARNWTVFVHQLFANLLESGGLTPATLWRRLHPVPSFSGVTLDEFATLVAHLRTEGWLDEADGVLMLGQRAEKVFGGRNFFKLYAVFDSPQVLTVRHAGHDIGTIQSWFVGQLAGGKRAFRLAGRAWATEDIDLKSGTIRVRPAPAGVVPSWTGRPAAFSRVVCERILDLLVSNEVPLGVSPTAAAWLEHAREQVRGLGLGGRLRPVVRDDDRLIWYTFAGARINLVLARLLTATLGVEATVSNISVKIKGVRPAIVEGLVAVQEMLVEGDLPPVDEWGRFDTDTRTAVLSAFQACLPDEFEQEFLRTAFLDVAGAVQWAREVEVGEGMRREWAD
ncbi:ATP-dependent helicase [Deltaproteobacteria bacterium]|nr:ATP-dependent helicase [Deltaproteobacteria bacterium]